MDRSFALDGIPFVWDLAKAATNLTKHGVDFETACEAFLDPFVQIREASDEQPEHRQAIVGLTTAWKLLFVVFVEHDDILRIISARPATAVERKLYENQ